MLLDDPRTHHSAAAASGFDSTLQPHGADLVQALAGNEFTDYLIQFAATKNPNGGRSNRTVAWPKYHTRGRKMLRIVEDGVQIGRDTDRLAAMEALSGLSVMFPM